ncbi:MAG: hypothetical protein HUU35_10160 [Armatimonadetes bacterium]|nr:hypothetical protein [Armatimonadota bacterium]
MSDTEREAFVERSSASGLRDTEVFTEAVVLLRRRPEDLPMGWADLMEGFVRRTE